MPTNISHLSNQKYPEAWTRLYPPRATRQPGSTSYAAWPHSSDSAQYSLVLEASGEIAAAHYSGQQTKQISGGQY